MCQLRAAQVVSGRAAQALAVLSLITILAALEMALRRLEVSLIFGAMAAVQTALVRVVSDFLALLLWGAQVLVVPVLDQP
jgi:hypothetical protein